MLRCYTFIIICVYLVKCDKLVYPCRTPNGENANCVSLFTCPILMKSLGSLEPDAIAFVKNSICLDCKAGDFMVCCGTAGNYLLNIVRQNQSTPSQPVQTKPAIQNTTTVQQPNISKEAQREYVKSKLIPSRKYCGLQHTDDRFYNETETALDEFPWLVHIRSSEHDFEAEYGDRCNGVLISNRYVLTDAYCGWHATVIKLGQYNTSSNVSCVDNPDFEECTEPTTFVKVEEKIRSGKQENGAYDFTLLRLDQQISYTDYIRPICLPVEGSLRPPSQPTLTFSGWGASGPETIVKKRLNYNVTDDKVCYDVEVGLDGNVKFANVSLACLIPKENNGTDLACNGEHGGPLMYSYKHQWFVDGIIIQAFASEGGTYTANFNSCSNKDPVAGIFITPGFMEWIIDNIRD